MSWHERTGMYFFTIGSLLVILAGAFPVSKGMFSVVTASLLFFGVFSAILNIEPEEELGFMVSASSFLIVVIASQYLLEGNLLVIGLFRFFKVATIFVGSMLATVALKIFVDYGGDRSPSPLEHADEAADDVASLLFTKKERIWNFIIFLSVAASFIIILLEVFFIESIPNFMGVLVILDIIITVIFFVDLIILYRKNKGFGKFIRNCWLDIIATIPFHNFLRIAKLGRLMKLSKIVKMNKTLKFFSDTDGVKHYIKKKPELEAKLEDKSLNHRK